MQAPFFLQGKCYPSVGVPPTIAKFLCQYRELFGREKGFDQVGRYISGLLLSPNKTLEGIHAQQIWEEGKAVKRRAMHTAVERSPME